MRYKGLKKARLEQSVFDQNRALIECLSKRDFSAKLAATLLLPYLESIVTSLQKVGYISGELPSHQKFLSWMKTSKEWHHIQNLSSQKSSDNFNLYFYLLRSYLRYLAINENQQNRLDGQEQKGLVDQIYKYFDKERENICDKSSSIIFSLYFEGLTPSEISPLLGVDVQSIKTLIHNSKKTIIDNLSERIKKNDF